MRISTILAALAVLAPSAALARPLEVYEARLSAQDHFNSSGGRLTTVAAIIRQDRANYHRFDQRDPEDEGDRFFASADNRARLEALIDRGSVTPRARREILNGTPLVVVRVWEDYVEIDVR
jgi:hypothetical protein